MMIGRTRPRPSARSSDRIKADPRNYIAQPTLSLSRVAGILRHGLEGRHVDLRPFIVTAGDPTCCPGV